MIGTTFSFYITIQGPRTPEYLETRIDAFLEGYRKTLSDMSLTEFEMHKGSLLVRLSEKMYNLEQESSRLWSHIEGGYFDFELGPSSHFFRMNSTN
jgi:insulysin